MQYIRPTLQMNDLKRILGVSVPTIHRRLKASREGRDSFPLPIGKRKQKLLWDHNAILSYLEGSSQKAGVPKIETPSQRRRRHEDAMRELERLGVKVKPRNEKEVSR